MPTQFALLVQGLALGLSAAASPGPFQAYLITQTLSGGWRHAAPVAFAPLISDGPIIIGALILLGHLPPVFLRVISLAGGTFVLYLSWGLWKQWRTGPPTPVNEPSSFTGEAPQRTHVLWRGVMMNLLSPGPYTFWTLVTGPILLAATHQSWLHTGAFLGGFYGALIGGMLAIASVFHLARRLGPRLVHGLLLASVIILTVFGFLLLYQGVV
ncbi:MAG: LysE family transporter [Anaerolineales bacterium]|jgi:threonine/homoserine/homoserine lactone efflux protein